MEAENKKKTVLEGRKKQDVPISNDFVNEEELEFQEADKILKSSEASEEIAKTRNESGIKINVGGECNEPTEITDIPDSENPYLYAASGPKKV